MIIGPSVFFAQEIAVEPVAPLPIVPEDIHLTQDSIAVIQETMRGFLLPPSAVPAWAEKMTDEQLRTLIASSGRSKGGRKEQEKGRTETQREKEKEEEVGKVVEEAEDKQPDHEKKL